MGLPASDHTYTIGEIHIFRIRDGKVAEHWHEFDKASLMQQLSDQPAGAGARTSPGEGPAASA
jgi:hypothetical protein